LLRFGWDGTGVPQQPEPCRVTLLEGELFKEGWVQRPAQQGPRLSSVP